MNPQKTKSATWALLLIAVALAGAGVSYHFTLESRFAALEQKLDQNAAALQQYQVAQDSTVTSKLDALNTLSREVDALQTLGKTTHDQSDSLMEMHKQIAALEESQQAQLDAQKKLAETAQELEKLKHEASTPPQMPIAPVNSVNSVNAVNSVNSVMTTPPAPMPAPVVQPRTTMSVPLPLPPRADNAVDLRPDQSTVTMQDVSVRALPVALPVADSR